MESCPCCGQTLPPPAPDLDLTQMQRRILDIVRRAGPHGISSDVLVDRVYRDDPDGGPLGAAECLHVQVHQLNKALRKINKLVRASSWGPGVNGTYRYIDRQAD